MALQPVLPVLEHLSAEALVRWLAVLSVTIKWGRKHGLIVTPVSRDGIVGGMRDAIATTS